MPWRTRLGRLWPLAAMLVAIVAFQAWWSRRFTVTGHAAEHLSSATAVFGITFMVGIVVWGVGPPHRRRAALWVLAALIVAGAIGVAVGNVGVIDAMGGETWSYEEAETRGAVRPGFRDGHERAQQAAWGTVAMTILLAGWLGLRRVVAPWVAGAAIVASALFPSWILPGAGLLVLALALVVAQLRRPGAPPVAPSDRGAMAPRMRKPAQH